MPPNKAETWHSYTVPEIARRLGANLTRGLTSEQAEDALRRFGANQLAEEPPPSLLARFLAQLADITVVALLVAALAAGALGFSEGPEAGFLARYGDALAILTIVVLNALLGLVQEKRAERALHALRRMTSPSARVLRDGHIDDIPCSEIVPGDVLKIAEGDRLPADARVVEEHNLEVSEAALTGESAPVDKTSVENLSPETPLAERLNMLFMGTEVSRGRATALVTSTGMSTELGRIAGMLSAVEFEPTPLQRYLNRFGKQIVVGCVLVSVIVFIAGFTQTGQSLRELFLTAVSLAVAAIPEGLPAITTIVLALGTQRMSRRHALVRRLPAVEGLGSAQVICTDKTGTLTQNIMTVRRVFVAGQSFSLGGGAHSAVGHFGSDESDGHINARDHDGLRELLDHAAHAPAVSVKRLEQNELEVTGNPTDAALRVASLKGGAEAPDLAKVRHELPFSSDRKVGTLVIEHPHGERALVRGAPEVLIERSTSLLGANGLEHIEEPGREALRAVAEHWGSEGMRVVALARRDHPPRHTAEWEYDLTFVGLAGIVDPPRIGVKQAIAQARRAGITTVMITGDQQSTAEAIGRELGLCEQGDRAVSGPELDMIDQGTLESQVDRLRVVARATPLHKLRIVEALKARGLICAMTGDGVNDAPAVKAASIGLAMGRTGTEVTKEAADLVLADDNYTTIVAAVEEGRSIFSNIRKFIFFLLSSNAGIVLTVFAAGLLGWAPPLAPIQILWINLVTNGLPALALGVEPTEPGIMNQPPRDPRAPILGRRQYAMMLGMGALMAAAALTVFAIIIGNPMATHAANHRLAQTACFAVLSLSPMFHAFNCRSDTTSNVQLGWFANHALWGSVAVGVSLVALAIYVPPLWPVFRTVPLEAHYLWWVLVASALPLLVLEPIKLLRRSPL